MNYRTLIFGILMVIYIFVFLKVLSLENDRSKNKFGVKQMVRSAVFGALSGIFYIYIKFPVPFLPSFLEFHFDEVPAFIASFAYGPVCGLIVLLIKTIIKLPLTTTLGVGELCDLAFSISFILPASLIYKRKRNFRSALTGMIFGLILQLVVSLVVNVYITIPFYMDIMGFSEEAILNICQIANPKITNIGWSYGLMAVLPFNLIKNVLVILLTIFTYKSVHRFIERI